MHPFHSGDVATADLPDAIVPLAVHRKADVGLEVADQRHGRALDGHVQPVTTKVSVAVLGKVLEGKKGKVWKRRVQDHTVGRARLQHFPTIIGGRRLNFADMHHPRRSWQISDQQMISGQSLVRVRARGHVLRIEERKGVSLEADAKPWVQNAGMRNGRCIGVPTWSRQLHSLKK